MSVTRSYSSYEYYTHPNESRIEFGKIRCCLSVFLPCCVTDKYHKCPKCCISDITYKIDCCYLGHEIKHGLIFPTKAQLSSTYIRCGKDKDNERYVQCWYILLKLILCTYYFVGLLIDYFSVYCSSKSQYRGCYIYFGYISAQSNIIGLIYLICDLHYSIIYRKDKRHSIMDSDVGKKEKKRFDCSQNLLTLAMNLITFVSVQYYAAINPEFRFSSTLSTYANTHTHGVTWLILLIVYLISLRQLYYKSFLITVYYGFFYCVWLYVHYLTGIGNNFNDSDFLYGTIDFGTFPIILVIASYFIGFSIIVIGTHIFLYVFIKNGILICCAPSYLKAQGKHTAYNAVNNATTTSTEYHMENHIRLDNLIRAENHDNEEYEL